MNLAKSKITSCLLALALCLLCFVPVGLYGCAGESSSSNTEISIVDISDDSEGIAATVNGEVVGQKAVTAYIDQFRQSNNLTADDDWGEWLVSYGYTIDGIWSDTVDMYVNKLLVQQAADKEGITASDSDIDEQLSSIKESYESDDDWNSMLEASGYTEDEYRKQLKTYVLSSKLMEKVSADAVVDDDDVLEYVVNNYDDYAEAKSLEDVDASVVEEARDAALQEAKQLAYSEYMYNFRQSSDIQKEYLPEDASYAIDLTPYEEAYYADLQSDSSTSSASNTSE